MHLHQVGLGATDDLQIPGENPQGCRDALSFIEETKSKSLAEVQIAKRIAVIGGGNTAIDVVTAARRLGAEEVYMVYRRGPEEMSAFDYEFELAKKDMVLFWWQALPVRIIDDGQGNVAGLACLRTQPGPTDARGRTALCPCRAQVQLDGHGSQGAWTKRRADFLQQIAHMELKNGLCGG
jgi:glutamate synthase (NADPH/NADH) small chain